MTQYPDLFAALAAPFDPQEVRVRSQAGRQLAYITARTAMNRLDSILGPENWWDEYVPGEHSVLCRLTVRLPDGTMLTKADAGGYAGMPDSGDDEKSGFSDAFKRAAVKFGVGRYLYRDGVPAFVRDRESTSKEPIAPEPPAPTPEPSHEAATPQRASTKNGSVPRSGRALFAWTKDQEQRHEVGLLKYLNSWAKLQDFPGRMVDWDADQVCQAYGEAIRKLQSISTGQAEAYEEALAN
ncbi:Rad52/Rad22 family DNA repair protein [Tundrisphaera lichenicola]|uniref:Rad52/Rad22 family DNA repair protein n=1 Tax=Tundrisphaera lichenicola TaxID=2029860 RepID=UPI003EBE6AD2